MTYIVFELAPYILCEAGRSPIEVAEMLNCLGYECYDGKWVDTHSDNKFAKNRDRGFHAWNDRSANRSSFETWASSIVGFTDLICAKPSDMASLLTTLGIGS